MKFFSKINYKEFTLTTIPLLFILLFYKWKKAKFFQLITHIKSLPVAIINLLGIQADTQTGNINFFLFYFTSLLFFWFAWRTIKSTSRLVFEQEQFGRIYRSINQTHTRTQFLLLEYKKAVIQMYYKYGIWMLFLLIMLLIGSANWGQRAGSVITWGTLLIKGGSILTLYLSLTFLLAIYKLPTRVSSKFCNAIIFLPWILANAHKLISLYQWLAANLNNAPSHLNLENYLAFLKKLYWVSPISWYNPFTSQTLGMHILQTLFCIAASLLALVLSNHICKTKDYYLP